MGLNLGKQGEEFSNDWRNFHSTINSKQKDYKIRYNLNNGLNKLLGSYMTDLFKGIEETDSRKLLKEIKQGEYKEMVEVSTALFRKELELLEKNNNGARPILIGFGEYGYNDILEALGLDFKVHEIRHYSHPTTSTEDLGRMWRDDLANI